MSEDVQSQDSREWEPRIVAFFCNWCTYTASDLAGVSRMTYAPNTRVIRVMCSGRIDPQFVLTALRQGADGVLIGGCHPGDCHYQQGNYYAQRRYAIMHKLLDFTGVESERLFVDWVSASEGKRFADVVTTFTDQVRELGPMQLNGKEIQMKKKLQEASS